MNYELRETIAELERLCQGCSDETPVLGGHIGMFAGPLRQLLSAARRGAEAPAQRDGGPTLAQQSSGRSVMLGSWIPDGPLEVVLFPEEQFCLAQCLQVDVAAQGDSVWQALDRLGAQLEAEHLLPGWSQLPAAPHRMWSLRAKEPERA